MADKTEEQLKQEAEAAAEAKAKKDAADAEAKAEAKAERERLEALAIHRRQESKNWVEMSKGNEIAHVHHTCVDSHKSAGWTVVE